jgi:hypothetical protein
MDITYLLLLLGNWLLRRIDDSVHLLLQVVVIQASVAGSRC